MTLMQIREIVSCPQHKRTIIMLEDVQQCLRLTFYADPDEAHRLARSMGISPYPCVPVLELIDGLLTHFQARVLRVVLDGDDVEVSGTLYIRGHDGEMTIACHAADGLALAERAGVPIYATDEMLRHACPLGQPHHHGIDIPHGMQGSERVRLEDFHAYRQGRN